MSASGVRQWAYGYVEKALKRGPAYTSLDVMKLFAIVNMTCDHIGFFFYPEDLWWRAVGRLTFPVWFFLAGYSRSRAIDEMLWAYAILLIFLKPCLGEYFFPLNALVSIILCRLLLNLCESYKLMGDKLPYVIVLCIFISPVTPPIFEYGSIAFIFAFYGRLVANKQKKHLVFVGTAGYLTFIFWQFAWFKFNILQDAYVVLGTLWVVWWLANFKNIVIWPDWRENAGKTFTAVLSRNTMPYYFYHRLIFETLAAFLRHSIHFAFVF